MDDRERDTARAVPAGYRISADSADCDAARVHTWLSGDAYWALGRSREVMDRAIAGSEMWSVLSSESSQGAEGAEEQVGVARVVTDGAIFAWLCDVYIDPSHRGRGLGSALVGAIVADLEARGIRRMLLATRDAHEVYAGHGFTALADPGMWMERDRRDLRPSRG